MSEELIIKHCAPTLAGMKTGNMFSCRCEDEKELRDTLRKWNQILVKRGLRVVPLKFQKKRALIYVYRPSKLSNDLKDETACRLLCERGYGMETPERCIVQLMKRIKDYEEFPHEVGLFLGYPPEDVRGFIENKACDCKCVGCWKVYGDAKEAQKTFEKYKKCTDVYSRQYANGKGIDRLAVAG